MELPYIVFGFLSILVLLGTLFYAKSVYKRKKRGERILSILHLITLGVFISTVILFLPIFYVGYHFQDTLANVRPFLLSINTAFRVFIMDVEFSTILEPIQPYQEWVHVVFSGQAAVLFVLAPFLTFGNVLSLFKSIMNEFRFWFHRRRPFYIFSELNEKSIVLAESIVKSQKIHKPVLVFTDVFEKNEESDYELVLRAQDLRAICFKKDISRLKIQKKKPSVELFLIGENESENVEQAIKLTNNNRNQTKRAIYVFSSKQVSGYILDSLDKGDHVLSPTMESVIRDHPMEVLCENKLKPADFCLDETFYLRRINSVDLLSTNILSDESIVKRLDKASKETKRISVMIIGTGEYGKAFLKTALWLYQRQGYMVELTVVDKEEKSVIEGKLLADCPDLKLNQKVDIPGDANYHVRIIDNVDVNSSDLNNLFETDSRDSHNEWIDETQLVIVALGDDDQNIETAVRLRRLFDYKKGIHKRSENIEETDELPLIYSIVYNDRKAANLSAGGNGKGIMDYKEEPYHIHFVGSLQEQYSYDVIENVKKAEEEAILYHVEWVGQTSKMRNAYYGASNSPAVQKFRNEARTVFENRSGKKWGQPGYKESWDDADFFTPDNSDKPDYDKPQAGKVRKEIVKYMNFEYYRYSSIAKSLHKKISPHFTDTSAQVMPTNHDEGVVCMCNYCNNKRITEHMRWNAYMISIGYKSGQKRADRAQIHPDMIPWDRLPLFEKLKD